MQPVKVPGFTGINNRAPIDRLPVSESGHVAVRDAVNVDLTQAGSFQTRQGFSSAVAQSSCRSGFSVDSSGALVASASELFRFDGSALTKIDDLGSSFARVAYVKTPIGVVWSDGYQTKIVKDWVSGRILPSAPNPMPSISIQSGGSLVAGSYGVAFQSSMPDGRRSPMTTPIWVDVQAAGRIVVDIGTQENTVHLFITAAGGSIFYRQGQASSGSFNIALHNTSGEPVNFQVEAELPPARMLAFRNGRLFSAVGSLLLYTQPWSMVYRPASDFIPFPSEIRLVVSVDAGLFVATADKTWFIGGEPQEATMREVAPYGAVEGTLTTMPNSTDLMWFTPRGQIQASQDGSFRLMQDKEIQFPKAPLGASVFLETNGMRQHITSLAEPTPTGSAVARSFMAFIES